jgi:putative glutamine amidotransferase
VPFSVVTQKAAYGRAVAEAGGIPLWGAPVDGHPELPAALLDQIDGLVITGGDFDISPEVYGDTPRGARLDAPKPARTAFELALLRGALARDLPVLGICGGMQLMAAATGGRLVQDVRDEIPGALEHEQPTSPAFPWHTVHLRAGTLLARADGGDSIDVNSTHHQAVADPGAFEAWGWAPDGVLEALGDPAERRLGVQWHPELLEDDASRRLYGHLVACAREDLG